MNNLSITEAAYLAGIFDGEGSVGYYFKKTLGYHLVQVSVAGSDPRIMSWLKDKLQCGSVGVNKRGPKHIGWQWICNSKLQAVDILKTIRPFLIIKRDQVDLLLSFLDTEQKTRGVGSGKRLSAEEITAREEIAQQLKALKTANFQSIH